MKIIIKSILLFFAFLTFSCSSDVEEDTIIIDNIVEEKEVIEGVDFVSATLVEDTLGKSFSVCFVHEDKIYATAENETYMFDFATSSWSLLATDDDTPDFERGINFIRNDKWYRLVRKGLYTYDFEMANWERIKLLTNTFGIFSNEGFYVEDDDAVYFVDQTNGKENIFIYDLLTNELGIHGTYTNDGGWYPISSNAFIYNNTNYLVSLNNWNSMKVSTFNDNFTTFETVNSLSVENQLDGSVACQFGDYFIFGLGGVPTVDGEGNITHDPSNINFYYYNVLTDAFGTMSTPFYEKRRGSHLVTYNNEYYLVGGYTIKNERSEITSKVEKLEFKIVEK
ncbi:hypothetical protein [Maribacter sp. R86514]|uniref:hypothetical protein n=1 Tax=Maribacter sp. R86514 TaxID=3093854 RepID=UPI0037C54035